MDTGYHTAEAVRDSEVTECPARRGLEGPHLCDECRVFVYDESRYGEIPFSSGKGRVTSKEKLQRLVSLAELDVLASRCELYRLFRWQLLGLSEINALVLDWVELEDPNYVLDHGLHSLEVQCRTKFQTKERWEFSLCFGISTSSGLCAQRLGINRTPTPVQSLSSERVSIIQDWISSKKKKKDEPHDPNLLAPARLIHVSRRPHENRCRLITTSQLATQDAIEYATLSYCWGDPTKGQAPLKTTTETVGRWEQEQIPEDSMPRTLRDAVEVVRCLGIEYLWIDSLCIIQDSDEDWQRESQKMAAIYRESLVTIVTITSESCHDGFLESSTLPKVEIPYVSPNTHDTYWLEARHISFRGTQDSMNLQNKLSQSTWLTRGWTFQEYYFAQRLLVFAESEIFFIGSTDAISDRSDQHLAFSLRSIPSVWYSWKKSDDWAPFQYYIFWYSVLSEYSGRLFTVEADRLPAISSYADAAAMENGDEYLAGLWRADLHRGLLWITKPLPQREFRSMLHRCTQQGVQAPSWSWARSGKKVTWPGNRLLGGVKFDNLAGCKVEDAQVVTQGVNKFGQVVGGFLALSGTVKKLGGLRPEKGPQDTYYGWDDDRLVVRVWTDWEVPVESGQWMSEISASQHDGLLMFHTFTKKYIRKWNPDSEHVFQLGILLLPTDMEDEYWRVGVFEVRSDLFFVNAEKRTVVIV